MNRKKILWLCSWYPNKLEPFNGDFIQRQARAAALYNDIHVIHLAGDSSVASSQKEINMYTEGGLTEQIIYFKKNSTVWGRLTAHYRWLFFYRQAIRNYIVKNGKPDIVHVQVPIKAGIIAVWVKKRYKVPFVVTEHWGIYNDVAEDNYRKKNHTFKFYTKQIFEKAEKFISVSKYLADGVNRLVLKKEYEVIPNVVDTRLFFYKENDSTPVFRFIHVSNMVPLKNAPGILRAFAALHKQDRNTELVMVGDTEPGIRNLAISLGLQEGIVSFRGEIPYAKVAEEMQQANCFVLFSNIENSPCVIGEALCCGLPVISTDAGGIPELVSESESIFVKPGNEEQLTKAMQQIIKNCSTYKRKEIAENARHRFSYEMFGKKLNAAYEAVLKTNNGK